MEVTADTFLLIQKRVLCAKIEQENKEPTQRQEEKKPAQVSVQLLLSTSPRVEEGKGKQKEPVVV